MTAIGLPEGYGSNMLWNFSDSVRCSVLCNKVVTKLKIKNLIPFCVDFIKKSIKSLWGRCGLLVRAEDLLSLSNAQTLRCLALTSPRVPAAAGCPLLWDSVYYSGIVCTSLHCVFTVCCVCHWFTDVLNAETGIKRVYILRLGVKVSCGLKEVGLHLGSGFLTSGALLKCPMINFLMSSLVSVVQLCQKIFQWPCSVPDSWD